MFSNVPSKLAAIQYTLWSDFNVWDIKKDLAYDANMEEHEVDSEEDAAEW